MDPEKLPGTQKLPVHELSQIGYLILRPESTLRYHPRPLRAAYLRQLKHLFLQEFDLSMQKYSEDCTVLYCGD